MIYGLYKRTRDASWQCLIHCQISSLPVNLSQICRCYGIKIIKNSTLQENRLLQNERAKNMRIDEDFYIIVNDADPLPVQRYSIAHEIGHILLGEGSSEYEAERFAIGILAPACVIWGLDLHSAEAIAKLCNISNTAARIRAERMEVLYKRNKFLTSPLERQVYSQFLDFIAKNKGIGTGSHPNRI